MVEGLCKYSYLDELDGMRGVVVGFESEVWVLVCGEEGEDCVTGAFFLNVSEMELKGKVYIYILPQPISAMVM